MAESRAWRHDRRPTETGIQPSHATRAPGRAVISVGAGNQYGHPTKPVLQRLGQVKAKIFRTDHDGSVVIHSDGEAYKVETDK